MKNILVPIDFTEVGVNALRYALELFPDSNITALHVRTIPVSSYQDVTLNPSFLATGFWKEGLKDHITKELKLDSLPSQVKIKIRFGAVVSTIQQFSEEENYDAIVMGTRDKYNYFDQWFGTVSMGLVKTSNLPIYLIPKYASYKGYDNVMIASDDNLTDPVLVHKIKNWNVPHNAFVKFLHIQRTKADNFKGASESILNELFEKDDPGFSFEIAVLKDKDIAHSLLASAYDMKGDLLMVLPEDQSFKN